MVNTIILTLGLLLAYVIGFFCAIKSIQMGLRWQIQTDKKQEPVLNSPITTHRTDNTANNQYSKEVINEWLYGG